MAVLRLIMGDQLNAKISSLHGIDKINDLVFMCEVKSEATYVKHHKLKIAFLFAAMRHFAAELSKKGYRVLYSKLDDPKNSGSFYAEISKVLKANKDLDSVVLTHPGEYRVLADIKLWEKKLKCPVEIREDDRFLCGIDEFNQWAEAKQGLRMEFFYRYMRKKYNILMDGNNPLGGKWNYDADNRQPLKDGAKIIAPKKFRIDAITNEVIDLVAAKFTDHFGDLDEFNFAVNRKQALAQLDFFCNNNLKFFGTYQDAMLEGKPFLYHSLLSFYLNCGLLLPQECVDQAVQAYKKYKLPLNSVEAFIRQIIGWREFIRGIYWWQMPGYAKTNYLAAKNKLPEFFWTGETELNCLRQCISDTKKYAYAHHIQRLMVLGNYLLLTGANPDAVNEWYLIVYADAYEWVEMPNVNGMILFADDGLLASKPYAASGAYINKMSNYCKNCKYNVKEKNGESACPFNYLYWNFLLQHRDKFKNNMRMKMVYSTLDKFSAEKIAAIKNDSKKFLLGLNKNRAK